MIALKCKMCGGDLSVSPGASVGTCQYCGTTMTLPVTGSTQVADQFNRASGLRQGDEFDRASEVYLRLLEANPRDAEAHWGMVLCRFGIAYVEDPETGRRLPTCNRVRFGSILEDEDYLQAITWADGEAKAVYQAEAEAIAAIDRPLDLQIVVALSCTMCPELVIAAQHIAALNPNVRAEAYDLNHFPALKETYNVMSVPCLVLNGEKVLFGKKSISQLLDTLEQQEQKSRTSDRPEG